MQASPTPLPHAKLVPLPLNAVQLETGYWQQWQSLNQETSLMHGYRMLEQTGTLNNMRIAARGDGESRGKPEEFKGYVFQDSDIYKWLEASALALGQHPDAELESRVESVTALLASAQFPDGYLNSYFTFVKPGQRWTDLEWAHEMYCAGHLIEAGIAYKRATGRTNLFEIARKFADNIDATFGTDKRAGLCGHPEIELALVELYRETSDSRYLTLAEYFVDQRGHRTFPGMWHIGPLYMQDRVPVREATTVEGHAVRQLYLCAGVTDVYLETGERALLDAMGRLWDDMTRGKMYLTGGVGARGYGEMFGDAYELPNREAYCETCAAIAGMMWNWRMLLATNEVRYADALERILYNGFLSGIAMDGSHFFYENPLRSEGTAKREEWFPCACCPPNIMRQLELVGNYCATSSEQGVQIHQYVNGKLHTQGGVWRVESNYPWNGAVRVTLESAAAHTTLSLRVPAWCKDASITVDAERKQIESGAYTTISRDWKQGAVVELELPMSPRFVQSHPYVDATRGCVAIERGPLVYCIEQADQTADVNDLCINEESELRAVWRDDILNGVMTIQAEGRVLDASEWVSDLYRSTLPDKDESQAATLTAIPYYAWGNRGADKMRVWIPLA